MVYWCWSRPRDKCTPSLKKSWIHPCILKWDYWNRGTWEKIIHHNIFWRQKILKFFCKWTNKIQGSSVQPLKTLKPFELTWALKFMNVIETWETWESFVFKNHCDWIIFFQVLPVVPVLWADYSWLYYNGHLYRTRTSVKQTPKVGPCLSLLPLFDSL